MAATVRRPMPVRGRPGPKKGSGAGMVLLGVLVPPEDQHRLREIGRAMDRNMSWLARRLIHEGLDRIEREGT